MFSWKRATHEKKNLVMYQGNKIKLKLEYFLSRTWLKFK